MRPRTSLFKPREALLLPLSKRYCRLRRGTTAPSLEALLFPLGWYYCFPQGAVPTASLPPLESGLKRLFRIFVLPNNLDVYA